MADLSQEQIDGLIKAIEKVERRRKIMLAGYLVALIALVGGEVAAVFVVASLPPGPFNVWVFLIPFALVGLSLWGFGRWARRSRDREKIQSG